MQEIVFSAVFLFCFRERESILKISTFGVSSHIGYGRPKFYMKMKRKLKKIKTMLQFLAQVVFGLEFCHRFSDIYFMSVNSVESELTCNRKHFVDSREAQDDSLTFTKFGLVTEAGSVHSRMLLIGCSIVYLFDTKVLVMTWPSFAYFCDCGRS